MPAEPRTTQPDISISVRQQFGIDTDMQCPAFTELMAHVPSIDPHYRFQRETTLAICAGFAHNQRTLIQGYHGTGKSTHIEQVAARLRWPCVRINLDGHITRMDLIGKDAIVLHDNKQVTEFSMGILPWALTRPMALVFDEYDAARPDVMFLLQRVLEHDGKLTLLEQKQVLTPHPSFRLFATANTIGLGDSSGLYHGTQQLNQGQLDRWNSVVTLNYLSKEEEIAILLALYPHHNNQKGRQLLAHMVTLANLTRTSFAKGDLSTVMSPRTVMSWVKNHDIFADTAFAFRLSFFNRSDESEHPLLNECYQRCFNESLMDDGNDYAPS